ncbi:MAG: hypothetical protein HY816_20020 [Candidatus Wallbacteria bacterium]|nr:hypothetical protein [Candidatus Wallbacteria bacterium]
MDPEQTPQDETKGGDARPPVDPEHAPARVAPIFVVRRQEVLLDQVVLDQTLSFVRDGAGRLVSDMATVEPHRRDEVLNVLAQFPSDFRFEDETGKEILPPSVAEPEVFPPAVDVVEDPPPATKADYMPGHTPGRSRKRRGR